MELLPKNRIQYSNDPNLDWQHAIALSAAPLLEQQLIGQDYVDAVIQVCQDKGPYMNIGPQIVLAHARPLPSTKQPVISLLQTTEPVDLINEKHPARLWFFLATPDDISHMNILKQLAQVLMNPQQIQLLLEAKCIDDLAAIFAGK